jgi:hypothetical protein
MWTAPSFKLATTCGAFALKDAIAPENADIIQKVRFLQVSQLIKSRVSSNICLHVAPGRGNAAPSQG